MGRGIVANGAVFTALALASGFAPGCSRTGLDDDALPRPVANGGPSPSQNGQDGASSDDTDGDADASGSDGSEGGEFFTSDDSSDDGPGAGGSGDGGPPCGPLTCQGCCAAGGSCEPGLVVYACGNGGQRCSNCGPERDCTSAGVCG
jgi:hypothetical protein